MNESLASGRRWLVLLLGLTLVRGLIYAAVIPPWQAPDEWGHFESSHLVARWGRLALTAEDQIPGFEREIIGSAYESRFWRFSRLSPEVMPTRLDDMPTLGWHRTLTSRVSLAYVLYAVFDRLVLHQDIVTQLYVLRASSVLVNLALVWVCWAIVREIFPISSAPALAVMSLMVFHPQHTFMHAVVNDGNLVELMMSLIYLLLVLCWRRGWGWRRILTMIVVLVVALWTKRTAYVLLVYMPLIAALYAWRSKRLEKTGWGVFLLCVAILVSAFLLPTHFDPIRYLERRIFLLGEEFSSVGEWIQLSADQAFTMWWSDPGMQLTNLLRPKSLYIPLAAFSIGGLLGWVRLVASRGDKDWLNDSQTSRYLLVILGLAFVAVVIFVMVALIGSRNMSGRYFFSAFIPTVIVVIAGWAEWIPMRLHGAALKGLFLLLVLLDWWVIVFHLVIRYHAI